MTTPTEVMLADRFYVDLQTIKSKKILLRVDFNVSIKNNKVESDFRIRRVIPTIRDLINAGAKVVLLAHIDDKEGGTLEPIARHLIAEFPRLFFVSDIYSHDARVAVDSMNDGDVVLFENLRKWPGEKENDPEFAKHLSSFGDIYINEAFSVSHRKHASIDEITKLLPSYFGFAFRDEITRLSDVFYPHKPFLVVMGGAKFETKVPLVSKFLDLADLVLVGGAIANDFFRAKDFFVGDSLVSETEPEGIRELLNHNKLILPLDVYTSYKGERLLKHPNEVGVGERILDVGDKTIKMLKIAVAESEFVLWNGPLGKSESGYSGSTETFAKILADSGKITIVGGGDVISSIEKLGILEKFSFVSTGGGAMLDFLADETLVGIESIIMSHRKNNFYDEKVVSKPDVQKKGFFEKMKKFLGVSY